MRNFLGKSVDDAEAMFREREDIFGEDLMFMGIIAFRYYISAALRYVRSQLPDAHPPMIFGIAGTIAFRLEFEQGELRPVAAELATFCGEILERFTRFDEFDDLVRRYPELLKSQGLDYEDIMAATPSNLRQYVTQLRSRLTDLIDNR